MLCFTNEQTEVEPVALVIGWEGLTCVQSLCWHHWYLLY